MKYFSFICFFCILGVCAQESGFIENGDSRIAYQKFGNGYPLLIINGGPGMNSNGFAPLARELSETNTSILYDQRGTGKSRGINSAEITIDLMLEDIESLRKGLGYDQWIVLGHSFGGMLAYAYAAKYPDKVKAMIQSHSGGMSLQNVQAFNINNRLSAAESDSLQHYRILVNRNPSNGHFAEKRAYFMAKAYLYESDYEDAVAERLLEVNRELNGRIWADMRAKSFNKTAEMRNFRKNVLILHGKQDVVPLEVAEGAHQILSNSRLIKMDKCGHYGWLDRPDVYLKEVKDFLKANSEEIN